MSLVSWNPRQTDDSPDQSNGLAFVLGPASFYRDLPLLSVWRVALSTMQVDAWYHGIVTTPIYKLTR